MVLFLTIVLLISCAGMALILFLKQRELRSGRVFLGGDAAHLFTAPGDQPPVSGGMQ